MPNSGDNQFDETFEEFKNSFSYGSRTDLTFKFLKALSPERAAEFMALILDRVGSMLDDGSPDDLIELVYRGQVEAYRPKPGVKRRYVYDDRPFQPLPAPLSELAVGLMTSSGHFSAESPPPFMDEITDQEELVSKIDEFLRQAPHLSEIPLVDFPEKLEVRHPGYDVRSVSKDPAVAFPAALLEEAAQDGRIGSLASTAYSFVGACAQGMLRKELDGWVATWKAADVEVLFLVPV